jgi:hypothetical protein
MNKNFYKQALTADNPWMRMQAYMIVWIYFYKWLCIDKNRFLSIKSLEEARNYAKQLQTGKSRRKFKTSEFSYILRCFR